MKVVARFEAELPDDYWGWSDLIEDSEPGEEQVRIKELCAEDWLFVMEQGEWTFEVVREEPKCSE